MGNEQSGANGGGGGSSGVSTSLSFLAGKKEKDLLKRSGQVVVVRPGSDQLPNPADDEIVKRFKEIPKFYPVLRSALNQASLRDPPDITMKIGPRPILRFAYRLQDHLAQCALAVATEQDALTAVIRNVEYALSSITGKVTERKKRFDRLAGELQRARELQTQIINVRFLLQDLVPCVETLNEILPVEERLPSLNLGRVLERTPVVSSGESSPEQGTMSRALWLTETVTTSTISNNLHIEPVEELTVIDKPSKAQHRP
uniref:BLOC-1-related complex subunit 5 n=1 Tax=Parascaris univalens TaxID=6257 RepID=A0A915ALJ0_PARUN